MLVMTMMVTFVGNDKYDDNEYDDEDKYHDENEDREYNNDSGDHNDNNDDGDGINLTSTDTTCEACIIHTGGGGGVVTVETC